MPLDRYGKGSGRSRLYGKAIYHPDIDGPQKFIFQRGRRYSFNGEEGIEFWQPQELNPDHGGVRRILPPFSESLYKNEALLRLMEFYFECATFDSDTRREAMQIGLHLITLMAGEDGLAVSSPDCIHRDGEPYTCAILVDRENVEGGENLVTDPEYEQAQPGDVPPAGVKASFTLTKPLDGYIVADDRVAHYVAPVRRADSSRPGYRSILLIDFTPLRPALVSVAAE